MSKFNNFRGQNSEMDTRDSSNPKYRATTIITGDDPTYVLTFTHTYTKSNDKAPLIVGQQRRHSTWFNWHCWIAVVLHPCNNHFYVGRIIFNPQGARWGNHPPRNIKQLVHARNLNPTPKSWSNYFRSSSLFFASYFKHFQNMHF